MKAPPKLHTKLAEAYEIENRRVPHKFARYILGLIPSITDSSIMHDNCCGPAVVTSTILNHTSASPRIIATDISPIFINVVGQLARSRNWKRVETRVMDAMKLDIESDILTHSIANFGIFYAESPERAIGEVWRTLKVGGVAAFTSWKSHGFVNLFMRIGDIIRPGVREQGVLGNQWTGRVEIEHLLVAGGFNDFEIREKEEFMRFESVEDLVEVMTGPIARFATREWTAEQKELIPRVIPEVLTEEERKRGGISMLAWVVIAKK